MPRKGRANLRCAQTKHSRLESENKKSFTRFAINYIDEILLILVFDDYLRKKNRLLDFCVYMILFFSKNIIKSETVKFMLRQLTKEKRTF